MQKEGGRMNKRQQIIIIKEDMITNLQKAINEAIIGLNVVDIQFIDNKHAVIFYQPHLCNMCMDMLRHGEVDMCSSCKMKVNKDV